MVLLPNRHSGATFRACLLRNFPDLNGENHRANVEKSLVASSDKLAKVRLKWLHFFLNMPLPLAVKLRLLAGVGLAGFQLGSPTFHHNLCRKNILYTTRE